MADRYGRSAIWFIFNSQSGKDFFRIPTAIFNFTSVLAPVFGDLPCGLGRVLKSPASPCFTAPCEKEPSLPLKVNDTTSRLDRSFRAKT